MTNSIKARRPAHVEKTAQISALDAEAIAHQIGHIMGIVSEFGANLTDAEREADDMKDALEEVLSFAHASTPVGALMQVMLASAWVDCLAQNEYVEPVRMKRERQVQRLLYSVIRYFEEQHGLDRSALGGDWYAGSHTDPHQRFPIAPLPAVRTPAAA